MKILTLAAAASVLLAGFAGAALADGQAKGNAYGKNGCANLNGSITGDTPGAYLKAQAAARTDGAMSGLLGGAGWLRTETNLGADNPNVVADWIARDCVAQPD
jgi:hypothetical protein